MRIDEISDIVPMLMGTQYLPLRIEPSTSYTPIPVKSENTCVHILHADFGKSVIVVYCASCGRRIRYVREKDDENSL